MQPSLERGLNGGAMDGFDLDQLEEAFPVAINAQRPATLGAVQQRPKRDKFCLEGAQRRLVLHDPLARGFEGTLSVGQALLEHTRRLAVDLQLAAGRLGGASPPIELVAQGAVAQGPRLELSAGLLLLLGQKLTAAFQLAELGLDRCGFSLSLVALLLADDTIRLERCLPLARDTLGIGRC